MHMVSPDLDLVDCELRAGRLSCPLCEGRLRPWGWARQRLVRRNRSEALAPDGDPAGSTAGIGLEIARKLGVDVEALRARIDALWSDLEAAGLVCSGTSPESGAITSETAFTDSISP